MFTVVTDTRDMCLSPSAGVGPSAFKPHFLFLKGNVVFLYYMPFIAQR